MDATTSAPSNIKEIKNKMYFHGKVVKTSLAGALVDIGIETPGMVHISQLQKTPVKRVEDVIHEGEEVDVVRVVREGIDAHRALSFDELLVGMDSMVVGLHGVVPPSNADVDVRGHVDHMSFSRHEPSETFGARHRSLRVHRFDRVDVVMTSAGMIGIAREDPFELA